VIGWRNTVRVAVNKDPVMPCGAELPHAPHAFPVYGPRKAKRYFYCEGVK
jgi:hypothetical protein